MLPERGKIEIGWPHEDPLGQPGVQQSRNAMDAHCLTASIYQIPNARLGHQAVRLNPLIQEPANGPI